MLFICDEELDTMISEPDILGYWMSQDKGEYGAELLPGHLDTIRFSLK